MNPLIVGGIIELGKAIASKFPNPEEKARVELEVMKIAMDKESNELSTRMSAILAEAQSTDPWTSRSRPMFMYVFYTIIFSLVIVAPLIGIFFPNQMELFFMNVGAGFKAIPEELWWTFSAGYLGYSGLRTREKEKGVAK